MTRRVTAFLVMTIVLFGATGPLFACAAMLGEHDCCPQETNQRMKLPCGESGHTAPSNDGEMACCIAMAPQVSAVSVVTQRVQVEPQHPSGAGSVDPIILSAWLATLSSPPCIVRVRAQSTATYCTSRSQTYLRTGRLRL